MLPEVRARSSSRLSCPSSPPRSEPQIRFPSFVAKALATAPMSLGPMMPATPPNASMNAMVGVSSQG